MKLIEANGAKLTAAEQQELQKCEEIIEAGLQEFVKVGNALLRIQQSKLYREEYETFEAYLKERWDITKRHGYRLLNAAEVVQNLKSDPKGHNSKPEVNSVVNRGVPTDGVSVEPIKERQVRPLTGLSPEEQREAWAIATNGNSNPTETDVKKAVEQVKQSEDTAAKVKEAELKVIAYLKEAGPDGATSEEIEAKTGVAHQLVNDLLKKGDAVYLTELGKRLRRKTTKVKQQTAYVVVWHEFGEKPKQEPKVTNKPGEPEIKTGKPAKPEDHIPQHLIKGIMTEDMLVQGYATSTDIHGDHNVLPIGVSKLQRDEEVATTIGGSSGFKDRKAYYKWQRYHETKIRTKVLQILERINPIKAPPVLKGPAFTYQYNLGTACDLRELVEMLHADLTRQTEMIETREKYAHLIKAP